MSTEHVCTPHCDERGHYPTGREQKCICDPALPRPMVDALCVVHGNRAPEPGRDQADKTTDKALVDEGRKHEGRCIGCCHPSGSTCGGCGAFVNDGWDGQPGREQVSTEEDDVSSSNPEPEVVAGELTTAQRLGIDDVREDAVLAAYGIGYAQGQRDARKRRRWWRRG